MRWLSLTFVVSTAVVVSACRIVMRGPAASPGALRVGHRLWHLTHKGIADDQRPLDVS